MNAMRLHDAKETFWFGADPARARGAVILIHGRGGSAEDIAGLADGLPQENIAFAAPRALQGTWYPDRFFVPPDHNEPWLSSGLEVIGGLVGRLLEAGIPPERIGLGGFSQGACLSLEYAFRHPRRYGFVAGLSGALIGPLKTVRSGVDLLKTPVLLGCAREDAYIPLPHVEESDRVFSAANAELTKLIFSGHDHTVFPEEMDWIRQQMSRWT